MGFVQIQQDLASLRELAERISQNLTQMEPGVSLSLPDTLPEVERLIHQLRSTQAPDEAAQHQPSEDKKEFFFHPIELIEHSPNAILRLDRMGKVLYANPASRSILTDWVWSADPIAPPLWIDRIDAAFKSGKLLGQEIAVGERWFAFQIVPEPDAGYADLYGREITRRKQLEVERDLYHRANQRHLALLDAVFEADPGGAAVLVGPDLEFTYVNPAYRLICPQNEADLIGLPYEAVWSGEDPNCFSGPIRQALETGVPFQTLGFKRHFADGTVRIFTLQARRIAWDDQPAVLLALWDTTSQRQVEQALRESEKKFRTVADFTFDWEYWIDPEGRLVWCSPSCQSLTGHTPEEFLRDPDLLVKIVHPGDVLSFAKHNQEDIHRTTDLIALEFRILTASGKERWVEHVCQPVLSPQGQPLGRRVSNRDITERKQLEDSLKESEGKFRTLFQNSPMAIALSRLSEGALVDVNQAFEKLFGYTREEAIGRTSLDLGLATDPHLREKILEQLQKQGFDHQLELHYCTKTGEPVVLFGNIDLVNIEGERFILNTYEDVTALKQAQEQVVAEREWFRTTLVSIGDAVITTDPAGKVTFLNPVAEQLTGWSRDDAMGQAIKHVFSIINELTGQPAENPVERVLREGGVRGLANHTALVPRDGGSPPDRGQCRPHPGSRWPGPGRGSGVPQCDQAA